MRNYKHKKLGIWEGYEIIEEYELDFAGNKKGDSTYIATDSKHDDIFASSKSLEGLKAFINEQ